jgi:hypothetical protein
MMYRSPIWGETLFSISLLLFFTQLIQGAFALEGERVKRIAFAIFGIGYLVVATSNTFVIQNEWLITNRLMSLVWQWLDASPRVPSPAQYYFSYLRGKTDVTTYPKLISFFLVGHCVFSWLFAVLAAWFAGRMYDRRERATKEAQ